jgi:hypothetical protein
VNTLTNGQIVLYETLGTAMLLLLGCGVVATAILRDSKGFGGGWLLINFGWGPVTDRHDQGRGLVTGRRTSTVPAHETRHHRSGETR